MECQLSQVSLEAKHTKGKNKHPRLQNLEEARGDGRPLWRRHRLRRSPTKPKRRARPRLRSRLARWRACAARGVGFVGYRRPRNAPPKKRVRHPAAPSKAQDLARRHPFPSTSAGERARPLERPPVRGTSDAPRSPRLGRRPLLGTESGGPRAPPPSRFGGNSVATPDATPQEEKLGDIDPRAPTVEFRGAFPPSLPPSIVLSN